MYYSGKYLDTFEMALSQLLDSAGLPQLPLADCMALRSFGFQAEGAAARDWFRPMISLPEALDCLSRASGIRFRCERARAPDGIRAREQGALFGPLEKGVAVPEVWNYYYRGGELYLFARPVSGGGMEVFDPRGFAGLRLDGEQWKTAAGADVPYCAWVEDGSGFRPEAPASVFERGLGYHNKISVQERSALEKACGQYGVSRENELSLHYATVNFLLQMDKNFRLAASCGRLSAEAEYQYILKKQELRLLSRQADLSSLPGKVDRIWSILENG